MTRDEAREALFALIDKALPNDLKARFALRIAAIDFASAAAQEAITNFERNMAEYRELSRRMA